MSERALIAGALVLGYLYMKNNGGLPASTKGQYGAVVPASVPASVGSGWQQAAAGALSGLMQGLARAPRNNTSVTTIPSNYDWVDRSNVIQEAVTDVPTDFNDLITGDDYGIRWA